MSVSSWRLLDEDEAAREMFYAHADESHPDKYLQAGKSCGTGSIACPECKWQVFIEVTHD
jgi:hypothetical protein